jgi:rhodanese-related sulfurtransferase
MKRALIAALAALLPGLVSAPAVAQTQAAKPAFTTVSSEAFASNRGGAVLIDVREPSEWAQTGMPKDSIGISVSRADFVDEVLKASGGDRSKPVALICRSGSRSVKAANALLDAGFTNVTNVGDGWIGREGVGAGWDAANLPRQTPPG